MGTFVLEILVDFNVFVTKIALLLQNRLRSSRCLGYSSTIVVWSIPFQFFKCVEVTWAQNALLALFFFTSCVCVKRSRTMCYECDFLPFIPVILIIW